MRVMLADPAGNVYATRVALDQFGRWMFHYARNSLSCARPIANDDGIIRYPQKPLGRDLLATAAVCVGRQLTGAEESAVLDLPVQQ